MEAFKLLEMKINDFVPEIKKKLVDFFNYFKRTWMNGLYNISEWIIPHGIASRTNNFSEAFNSLFIKLFRRFNPNLIVCIQKMYDISLLNDLKLMDVSNHPLNYLNSIPELNQYSIELNNMFLLRERQYGNNLLSFLNSLASIPIRLTLKIEMEILKEKNQQNSKRYSDIEQMLSGEKEISFFKDEDSDMSPKEKQKIKIITKYHIQKRVKKLREGLTKKEKNKIAKRQKEDILLTIEDSEILKKNLDEIDEKFKEENNLSEEDNDDYPILNDDVNSEIENSCEEDDDLDLLENNIENHNQSFSSIQIINDHSNIIKDGYDSVDKEKQKRMEKQNDQEIGCDNYDDSSDEADDEEMSREEENHFGSSESNYDNSNDEEMSTEEKERYYNAYYSETKVNKREKIKEKTKIVKNKRKREKVLRPKRNNLGKKWRALMKRRKTTSSKK